MPYITSEQVKEIRQEVKAKFPGFKFSIVKRHYSGVNIAVLKGPIDFGSHAQRGVNHFFINRNFKDNELARDFLLSLLNTVYGVREVEEESHDDDYGSIPNYYIGIEIGTWDKKYIQVDKAA